MKVEKTQANEDVAILVDMSTGLATKRTKPRRVPHRYIDRPIKDVMSYINRTIEQDGDPEDISLSVNIQDQMKGRQYVIKVNGQNVNPADNFGKIVDRTTNIDHVEGGGEDMKYREVSIVVTKVEEGGDVKKPNEKEKICKCGDHTINKNGVCDTCKIIEDAENEPTT